MAGLSCPPAGSQALARLQACASTREAPRSLHSGPALLPFLFVPFYICLKNQGVRNKQTRFGLRVPSRSSAEIVGGRYQSSGGNPCKSLATEWPAPSVTAGSAAFPHGRLVNREPGHQASVLLMGHLMSSIGRLGPQHRARRGQHVIAPRCQ